MADTSLIPNYITSSSPMGLRRAMLSNNAKYRASFNYFSIQFIGNRWYAWFYSTVSSSDPVLSVGVK